MALSRFAKFIAGIAGILLLAVTAHAAEWRIIDLGTLGGSWSRAAAINNRGQVVGTSSLAGDVASHAFLYTSGGMYDIGTLGGDSSSAAAINALGQVVGASQMNGSVEQRGFIYHDGKLQSIGAIQMGVRASSDAHAINNRGQIVGQGSYLAAPQAPRDALYAITYQEGVLGKLPDVMQDATGINDRGQVIGYKFVFDVYPYRRRALLFSNGKLIELGTLDNAPGSSSYPFSINSAGDIVGQSDSIVSNTTQAFLYRNGRLQNLGALLGFARSAARDINNAGDIVGDGAREQGAEQRAFLFRNGAATDLSSLPEVVAAGWTLTEANSINDTGQIVGTGYINGQQRAYLLSPVPVGARR